MTVTIRHANMDGIRELTKKRNVVVNSSVVSDDDNFSVVSYNILADCWVKDEW